jgi:hypothetical protein
MKTETFIKGYFLASAICGFLMFVLLISQHQQNYRLPLVLSISFGIGYLYLRKKYNKNKV